MPQVPTAEEADPADWSWLIIAQIGPIPIWESIYSS